MTKTIYSAPDVTTIAQKLTEDPNLITNLLKAQKRATDEVVEAIQTRIKKEVEEKSGLERK